MRYRLENEELTVEVESFGAEIKSVVRRDNGFEYMWQADPVFWGRTSPVLFPVVGSFRDKKYTYNGNTYTMGQHGFARDNEFMFLSQSDNEIWFSLKDTEVTRANFPFGFELKIGYRLVENCLTVLWSVKNSDSKELYFSIGAHPAFNVMLEGEASKAEYGLMFPGKEKLSYHKITKDGLSVPTEFDLPLEAEKVCFGEDLLAESAILFERNQCKEVALIKPDGEKLVTVSFDTPLFAIWSPEGKNAPFVCIEPWYGRCDAADFVGDLQDRVYGNVAMPGEVFERSYQISFE